MLHSLTVLEGSLPLHHFQSEPVRLLSSQTPLLTLTLMRPLLTSWVFITFQEAPTHSTVQLPPIHLQAPALQRRLGGPSSPALGRRLPTANGGSEPTTPNSPLLGRSGKFIPPSPVLDRHHSPAPVASSPDHRATPRVQATPNERHGVESSQSTISLVQPGPATSSFPLEQSCSPSLFLPLDITAGSIAENSKSVPTYSIESREAPTPTQGPAITSIYGNIRTADRNPENEITKLNRCHSSTNQQTICSFSADGPPDIRINIKFVSRYIQILVQARNLQGTR